MQLQYVHGIAELNYKDGHDLVHHLHFTEKERLTCLM